MADETKAQPTGGEAGAAGATQGAEGQTQQAQQSDAKKTDGVLTLSQAELDRINAKHRKRAEEAEARLKEIEDAKKSEAEKAIEKAREEERQKGDLHLKQLRIEHGVELELARRGLDPDLLPAVMKRAGEITDIADVPAAVAKALEGKAWAQAPTQGGARQAQTGAPAQTAVQSGRPWGDKSVREACQKMGYEEFNKAHAAEVEADRKAGVYIHGFR